MSSICARTKPIAKSQQVTPAPGKHRETMSAIAGFGALKTRYEGTVASRNPILGVGHVASDERGFNVEGKCGAGMRGTDKHKLTSRDVQLQGGSSQSSQPEQSARRERLVQRVTVDEETRNKKIKLFNEKIQAKFSTLRRAFRWMSDDRSHEIGWPELRKLLIDFNLDPDDEALHSIFLEADADGSGKIDYDEFQKAFGEIIQQSKDTTHASTRFYSGGGNSTPYVPRKTNRELYELQRKPVTYSPEEKAQRIYESLTLFNEKIQAKFSSLRQAFRWMDTDFSNCIRWPELQRLLVDFCMDPNDEGLHSLFVQADEDRSGHISYNEFLKTFGATMAPAFYSHEASASPTSSSIRQVPDDKEVEVTHTPAHYLRRQRDVPLTAKINHTVPTPRRKESFVSFHKPAAMRMELAYQSQHINVNPITGEGHTSKDDHDTDLDGRRGHGSRGPTGNRMHNHQNAAHMGRAHRNVITGEGLRAVHNRDASDHRVVDGNDDSQYGYFQDFRDKHVPSNLKATELLGWNDGDYGNAQE